MTIDMLGRSTILVTLGIKDLYDYTLDFSSSDKHVTEQGLKKLMYRVGEACGLTHRGRSYLVEALPSHDGCLLIISVHKTRRRRIYRIKHADTTRICAFGCVDDLLDWEKRAAADFGYSLYGYKDKFILLPELPASSLELIKLSEYGRVIDADRITLARVREYGTLVAHKPSSHAFFQARRSSREAI